MAFTLNQARTLLNATELELFQHSRRNAIGALGLRQLESRVKRARALRDKYRDLYQRQTVGTRQGSAGARTHFGGENDRTQRKAEVMTDVLDRFEERLSRLSAAQPAAAPGTRYPAPGARATRSSAPAPEQRMRRPAKGGALLPAADVPMRGATTTKKADVARRKSDAAAVALDVVADRAHARELARQRKQGAAAAGAKQSLGNSAAGVKSAAKSASGKSASGKSASGKSASVKSASVKSASSKKAAKKAAPKASSAPSVNLQRAVRRAVKKKQAQAPQPGAPRPARRGGANPSLAARPTDVPAVAEQRLDPLKAEPVNKKIHASARGRKQLFQAARDDR